MCNVYFGAKKPNFTHPVVEQERETLLALENMDPVCGCCKNAKSLLEGSFRENSPLSFSWHDLSRHNWTVPFVYAVSGYPCTVFNDFHTS